MHKLVFSILAALAAVAASAAPAAAVPNQVSFAGRLADDAGPVDGAVDLTFRLYDGATMVWEEDHTATAADGLVFVTLGSVDPLDGSVFTGAGLQLEIVIEGEPTTPRLPILSVPYAGRAGIAADAERLGGQTASAFAPAAHDHDGDYLPLGGTLACGGGQKVTGISAAGNVSCGADANTQYAAAATGGLSLAGTSFSIANNGVTTARILDGTVSAADLATNAVGADEIAAGAVGSSEIANDSITRSDLAGSEPAIYQRNVFCASRGGDLWPTSSACSTAQCAPSAFFTCTGSCSSTVAVSCAPTLVGYLVAP